MQTYPSQNHTPRKTPITTMPRKPLGFLTALFGPRKPQKTLVDAGIAPLVVEADSPIVGRGAILAESLGIETMGGVFTPLLVSGTTVPARTAEVFSTAADRQTEIAIRLYRGGNIQAKENRDLGEYQVVGIPPAMRGSAQVEITFTITPQHEIQISALDKRTRLPLVIQRGGTKRGK
jgi:molecular chaperone DnaK